jgi:hypothetical protein
VPIRPLSHSSKISREREEIDYRLARLPETDGVLFR